MALDIQKLSNKAYLFSVDTIVFSKEFEKNERNSPYWNALVSSAGYLAATMLNCEEADSPEKQSELLKQASDLADKCQTLLREIKCTGALLNEKTDLILETYQIKKQIDQELGIEIS